MIELSLDILHGTSDDVSLGLSHVLFSRYLTQTLLGGFEKIAGFIVASLAASLILAGASGFCKSLSTKVHEQNTRVHEQNTSDLYGKIGRSDGFNRI